MAVTFVQAVVSTNDSAGDDVLPTITIGSGMDRCLILCVTSRGGTSGYSAASDVDGAFTSAAAEITSGTGATNRRASMLYLLNPSSGDHDVTVSAASGTVHGVYSQIELTGVDQASPVESTDGDSATGGGYSSSTPPNASVDSLIVDSMALRLTAVNTITVGADQTQRSARDINTGVNVRGLTSTQPGSVSGDAMTWTYNNAQNAQLAVAFAAAIAAANVPVVQGLEVADDFGPTAVRLNGAMVL